MGAGREQRRHRPHRAAHPHQAGSERPATDLPEPHRAAAQLSDQGHAHHHSQPDVQPERLCVLLRSAHPAGGGARARTPAVQERDRDDAERGPIQRRHLQQKDLRRRPHPQRRGDGERATGVLQGDQDWQNSSRPEGQRRPAELALRASSEQRVPVHHP